MATQIVRIGTAAVAAGLIASATAASAQWFGKGQPKGIAYQQVADMLHAVMAADRAVYTARVVNRLQNIEKVIKADEHFTDKKALPLPAQMFRFGAETVAKTNKTFSYSLLSLWPVNKQNAPRTAAEKKGLQFVVDNKGKNFYTDEKLGGKVYYTAVYADPASSQACVSCHNEHDESPRRDFKLNDVMGGVVIRILTN
jgi:hypothetical protein